MDTNDPSWLFQGFLLLGLMLAAFYLIIKIAVRTAIVEADELVKKRDADGKRAQGNP